MLNQTAKAKLTPEQFGDLAKKLPEIRSQNKELAELIKSKPNRVKEVLGECYHGQVFTN